MSRLYVCLKAYPFSRIRLKGRPLETEKGEPPLFLPVFREEGAARKWAKEAKTKLLAVEILEEQK